jgi:hypothetical protein
VDRANFIDCPVYCRNQAAIDSILANFAIAQAVASLSPPSTALSAAVSTTSPAVSQAPSLAPMLTKSAPVQVQHEDGPAKLPHCNPNAYAEMLKKSYEEHLAKTKEESLGAQSSRAPSQYKDVDKRYAAVSTGGASPSEQLMVQRHYIEANPSRKSSFSSKHPKQRTKSKHRKIPTSGHSGNLVRTSDDQEAGGILLGFLSSLRQSFESAVVEKQNGRRSIESQENSEESGSADERTHAMRSNSAAVTDSASGSSQQPESSMDDSDSNFDKKSSSSEDSDKDEKQLATKHSKGPPRKRHKHIPRPWEAQGATS